MKLWQGWHNTDQDSPYFHYGPLGGTKNRRGYQHKTCKEKDEKHEVGNEKSRAGFFYLIVGKYVVILLF